MTRSPAACMFACAFALLAAAAPASAQLATSSFMLIPGIPGDSVQERYKNWIDVFSVTQTLTTEGKRDACSVLASKTTDSAGPLLWAAAVTGQVFNAIRIEVVKNGEQPFKFYEIQLNNARIGSITGNPSFLSENVTLTAQSITLSFFPQKPDGTPGTPVSSTVSCR